MNVRHNLHRCKTVCIGTAISYEELRHIAEHAARLKDIVNFHPTKCIGSVREITNAVLVSMFRSGIICHRSTPVRPRWLGRDLRLDRVMSTSLRVRVLLLHATTRRAGRTAPT
jgi:hypothetical protein